MKRCLRFALRIVAMVQSRGWNRRILLGLVAGIAMTLLIVTLMANRQPKDSEPSVARLFAETRRSLAKSEWQQAALLAEKILQQQPDSVDAILLLGQANSKQNNLDKTLAVLDRLPESRDPEIIAGRMLAADLAYEAGRLSDAEARYRALQTDSAKARRQLAYLLAITARTDAARAVLKTTLSDPLPHQHLFWVAYPQSVVSSLSIRQLNDWKAGGSTDPWVLTGLANQMLAEREPEAAKELLLEILRRAPDNDVADALLGRAWFDLQEWAKFQSWQEQPRSSGFPSMGWKVLGDAALQHEDRPGAVRAFLETVRLNPDNQEASYQAGQLLRLTGQENVGDLLMARAECLKQLRSLLSDLSTDVNNVDKFSAAIELLLQLGLLKEARAWLIIAFQMSPQSTRVRELYDRLKQAETQPTENQTAFWAPLQSVEIESFPMPRTISTSSSIAKIVAPTARIQLNDVASEVGLQFQFQNGSDPAQPVMRMHEFTGGGVAVIDIDGDLRPDLYFPQGGQMPEGSGVASPSSWLTDECFRNIGGTRFDKITAVANLQNERYAQGVTAGDVNGDGFTDLYVANIGTNRLFVNHGDGTFSEVRMTELSAFTDWTTSCAMADLTGDGNPDLYDVNYLAGENVYTLVCHDSKQIPRSCRPTIFPAAPDRFWENLGDGHFAERSVERGFAVEQGRGLGVVVFRDDAQKLPSLFIANDGEANFCFRPHSEPSIQYEESALVSGLAFDGTGLSQACMGIAANDLDSDGDTEFYVTNFYQESNTLYVRNESGTYDDATRSAGLREPSLPVLGFGTQFLDLDADGELDLLVANGHEGNYHDLGIPFEMPPQAFRGLGQLRFQELSAQSVGPYFDGRYLGRGLAVLDWNGDLRPDACVTHLDAPVALLTNQTQPVGTVLQLQLVGTRSARDAVNTQIRFHVGDSVIRRQLLAGDGYLTSNERRILIATKAGTPIHRVEIDWPSGQLDTIAGPVTPNGSFIIVEGRKTLVPLPQ
jgi:tetratricopeptide (TPR) repeat protein